MVRVLIADDDVDSHELMDDLIEINFRDVIIDHALTRDAFHNKIEAANSAPDLILFNIELDKESASGIISYMSSNHPDLLKRVVFIVAGDQVAVPEGWPYITRPFSLDHFEEVVKKVCA